MNLRGRNKVNAEFNMSSLTDIVFLLLIFFMIAVTTMTNTNALDLVLPNSSGQSDEVETISVSIDDKFKFFLDQQQLPIEDLEAALQQKLAGQKEPNIVLHVAKDVPIENAVKVMDIAYRNKYKIVLAVSPK